MNQVQTNYYPIQGYDGPSSGVNIPIDITTMLLVQRPSDVIYLLLTVHLDVFMVYQWLPMRSILAPLYPSAPSWSVAEWAASGQHTNLFTLCWTHQRLCGSNYVMEGWRDRSVARDHGRTWYGLCQFTSWLCHSLSLWTPQPPTIQHNCMALNHRGTNNGVSTSE